MYLYHITLRRKEVKETRIEGSTIYPLNELKRLYPKIYASEASKYAHRKHVMNQHIPVLHCLWNDVIHLSPFHPSLIRNALQETPGYTVRHFPFYKIPVESIDITEAVWWPFLSRRYNPQEVELFDISFLDDVKTIPQKTIEYYREEVAADRKPLLFVHVPHVFYKGTIDISTLPLLSTG